MPIVVEDFSSPGASDWTPSHRSNVPTYNRPLDEDELVTRAGDAYDEAYGEGDTPRESTKVRSRVSVP